MAYRQNKEKKRNRKPLVLIICLLVIAIVIGTSLYIKKNYVRKEDTLVTSDIVESTLKEAKELTSLKYHYKNIASYENSQEFYGVKIPFTTKRFLYTYEGTINAGVDLNMATIDVDNVNKTIDVTLPEAKILSHEIDENSVMMFDEKESVFNQLKLEDFSTFRAEEKAKVEAEAIEKGLLDQAKEEGKKAVQDILKINPEIAKEYTITVK